MNYIDRAEQHAWILLNLLEILSKSDYEAIDFLVVG